MDDTFLLGSAAFISAVLVFVGSIWLLLALVLGPRLSYLVTASTTLGFVLIMGVVWSIGTPLGPVGDLPDWNGLDMATEAGALDFGPASRYPDSGGWRAPAEDSQEDATLVGELENAAADFLEARIEAGEIEGYQDSGDSQVAEDSSRLLERDGEIFGALVLEPVEVDPASDEPPVEGEPQVVAMQFDAGNPNRPARQITAGTAVLLAVHLWALSRAERKVRRRKEAETSEGNDAP